MSTSGKTSTSSTPPTTSKPTTARKEPTQVAFKKAVAVKPADKKPVTRTQSALVVKKTSTQTPAAQAATSTRENAASKRLKEKKVKLVRDSFTIPKPEYLVLDALKARALGLGQAVKKSELLRAGIKALASMSDSQLLATMKSVPALKSGRPGK